MENALWYHGIFINGGNFSLWKQYGHFKKKLYFLVSSVPQLKFLFPLCILQPFGSFIVENPRYIHNCTTVTGIYHWQRFPTVNELL